MAKKIILTGCGYTSVWTYCNLSRRVKNAIKKGDIEVFMISDTPHHHFHGFTGEFLGGSLPLYLQTNHYRTMMEHVKFIHGTLSKVNQNKSSVEYFDFESEQSKTLEYEQLVLGVGSIDNDYQIPGLSKYGFSVKNHSGVTDCRAKIKENLIKATETTSEEERKKLLSFVIAGGGFAGIELIGNLCEALEGLKKEYPILNKGYQVHLLVSGDRILPHLDDKFKKLLRYTEKTLKDYGIQIKYSTKVIEVTSDKVYLSNDQNIDTQLLIYAIGQKRLPPMSEVPFTLAPNKTIHIDKKLRALGFENIWVGGDIAFGQHPITEKPTISNALWAMMQGMRIGKNISKVINGNKPKNFMFPGMGQTGSLGKNKGIMELYGIQFTGTIAWYLRLGFFLYFYPVRSRVPTLFKELHRTRNPLE